MPSAELNLEKPGVPIERGPSKIDSPKPVAGSEEQGMSALLKAKKRARDEMGDQDKG